jgi:hypothetical protein
VKQMTSALGLHSSTLKVEATCSANTWVHFQLTARCYISKSEIIFRTVSPRAGLRCSKPEDSSCLPWHCADCHGAYEKWPLANWAGSLHQGEQARSYTELRQPQACTYGPERGFTGYWSDHLLHSVDEFCAKLKE